MSILSLGLVESLDMRGVCVVRLPCFVEGFAAAEGGVRADEVCSWLRCPLLGNELEIFGFQECERGFLGWFSRAS